MKQESQSCFCKVSITFVELSQLINVSNIQRNEKKTLSVTMTNNLPNVKFLLINLFVKILNTHTHCQMRVI